MARRYDVIIRGTGNAGLGVARVTREYDKSVAIVEPDGVGGTCPLSATRYNQRFYRLKLVADAHPLPKTKSYVIHAIKTDAVADSGSCAVSMP